MRLSVCLVIIASTCCAQGGALTLTMSQPSGPGSARVANNNGTPGLFYFTAVSFDPANGTNPGGGFWGGLHISISDLATEILSGAPPFVGVLDANGASEWIVGPGTIPAGFPPVWGVTRTFNSANQITATSNIASLSFLSGPPGPPPNVMFQVIPLGFAAENRHSVVRRVNLDAHLDLVNSSGIWLGDGQLGFSFAGVDPGGVEAEVAELTGDAFPDLVVLDNIFNGFKIFPGDGSGAFFQAPIYLPLFCQDRGDVRVFDFDGDSDNDILVSTGAPASTVALLFQNLGAGQFAQFGISFAELSYACEAADLNGDSRPELIVDRISVGGSAPEETRVFWSDNWPSYSVANSDAIGGTPEGGSRWLRAADFDNDGRRDILWVGDTHVGVLRNEGGAGHPPATYRSTPVTTDACCPSPMATATDFNKDGFLDIALIGVFGGVRYLVIVPNNGNATFTSAWYIAMPGTNLGHVYAGDLDGDGDDDLVVGGSPATIVRNLN